MPKDTPTRRARKTPTKVIEFQKPQEHAPCDCAECQVDVLADALKEMKCSRR